jgi:hypothetical protein
MALKIAAVDKPWLQQMVLSERRRLAGLHRAALLQANTETAIADHKDDPGYTQAEADEKKAPAANKSASFASPDDPRMTQKDLETVNAVVDYLEDQNPSADPHELSSKVQAVWQPGMSITALISAVSPQAQVPAHAAAVKQASELKYDESGTPPNTETATQDHDFELKALAKQIQGFMGGKTEWDPNDPLKD